MDDLTGEEVEAIAVICEKLLNGESPIRGDIVWAVQESLTAKRIIRSDGTRIILESFAVKYIIEDILDPGLADLTPEGKRWANRMGREG